MENEKELTREELKGCIFNYEKVIELQKEIIESLKKENEFLSKKPEFNYRYQYENYKIYAEDLQKENNQLKKDFKNLDNDCDNLLKKCKKLESANEGLHKELSDNRFDKQIIKSLQDDKKQLIANIEKLEQENKNLKNEFAIFEKSDLNYKKPYYDLLDQYNNLQFGNNQLKKELKTLESKYNELKSQYDMGLIYSIKDGVVMTKKNDDLIEKEKIYKRALNKVFENNGFLVQLFSDYSNLQYCYDNFIKHGFDVQQVGSDTLIIRNK